MPISVRRLGSLRECCLAKALEEIVTAFRDLGAERILLVAGPQPLELLGSYGLAPEFRWTEQISLSILERCLREGSPLLMGDAQAELRERWSVAATDIRSVVCVPYWTPQSRVAGILYADVRSKSGVFTSKALDVAQACARKIETELFGIGQDRYNHSLPPEAPVARRRVAVQSSLGLRPAQPAQSARSAPNRPDNETPQAPPRLAGKPPDGRAVALFFRSLATMVGAGLPLNRALDILGKHSDSPAMQSLSQDLADRLGSGFTLSAAMALYPQVFARGDCQLVRVAEVSGQLHNVLGEVAEYREKFYHSQLKLRGALTYPALISFLTLTMLLLGPPYLLQGQFDLIRNSGQQPPLLTTIVMHVSDFLRQGGIPLIATLTLLALFCLKQVSHRPAWQDWIWRRAMSTKGLSGVLRKVTSARFAASFSVAYRVGVPVPDCLRLSVLATANPLLQDALPAMLSELEQGVSLKGCFHAADFFPTPFLQMMEAGEESGRVDEMMKWIATLYESEIECSIQTWLSLLEPALMMGMGIFVALMLIATLLPMVSILQSL